MINVGVIGYGYWGPNMVRNFCEAGGAQVLSVADREIDKLALVQNRYPAITPTTDYREIIANPDIDSIVVATPVASHFEIAMAALEAGKNVLIEKPMAKTADEASRLINAAQQRDLTLMVDHTFIYTGAVRKIRELIETGDLGEVYYYDSTRINLGMFQHDVDVIWDLAVHDLSILSYILGEEPHQISATGASHIPKGMKNSAYMTLFFESGTIAHINVNWLSPVKIRRTLIGGSKKMIVYDDLEATEKIKVYDKGITLSDDPEQVYQMQVGYRIGDMWAPQIDGAEALSVLARHFIDCVETGKPPITDGAMGLSIVRAAEAASVSMERQGEPVKIER